MLTSLLIGAAGVAGVLGVPGLRRPLLTRHIQRAFARALPTLSATEAAALQAGTPGFEAQFFEGRFEPSALAARAPSRLSVEERAFIDDVVDPLLRRLDDWAILQAGDLPAEVWEYLKAHRFFGLCVPKELGGLGFSHRAHSDIVMRIAAVSPSVAVTVMVPNSLGPAELLLHYGTSAQREHWVPRLARGEEIPCFALTSPWAGSDAAAIPDVGVVVPLDAADTGRTDLPTERLGLRLRWNKRYITLAPVASVMGLAFQTQDPQGYLGRGAELGISVALIPTSHPGVRIGKRHQPMTAAFMNGPTEGEDVLIPLAWVIGGPQQLGQGWRMLMECLAAGRAISLPALGVALAKHSALTAARYARVREQFGLPIGRFHAVAEPLARSGIQAHIAHCVRTFTVDGLDAGERSSVASAIAKYHLTELARDTLEQGMDILGGKAICQGPNNLLGAAWGLAPIGITVEGANILTRSLIIFGQGAVRSHPFVLREMASARDGSEAGLREFDRVFWAHARKVVADCVLADLHPLWAPSRGGLPEPVRFLRRELREARRLARAFSFLCEMLMLRKGARLKREELVSARLADMVSGLYMAAAVVRDALQRDWAGRDSDADLRLLVRLSVRQALYSVSRAMSELVANAEGALWRGWLAQTVTPFGAPVRPVSDAEHLELARAMLDNPRLVGVLEEGLLPGKTLDSGVHRDLALAHEAACRFERSGWKGSKLRDAAWRRSLSEEGAREVEQYLEWVERLIQVDAFGAWRAPS